MRAILSSTYFRYFLPAAAKKKFGKSNIMIYQLNYMYVHNGLNLETRPLEQTKAKCSWIFVQITISSELNKMTLKCKADQTAEFVL